MSNAAAIRAAVEALTPAELAELEAVLAARNQNERDMAYAKLLLEARERMIPFCKVTMPNLSDRADPYATRYHDAKHHRVLAAALEQVEKGAWLNLIITMPPRHGKSELASKRFPAWFIGRDPYRQVIFGTYNEDLAGDTGREVRDILKSDQFRALFPEAILAKGAQSADRIKTSYGGGILLAGRGGSVTGRGADLLIVDDPLKSRAEAESRQIRNSLWSWYQDDLSTRLLSEMGRKVIIMTRWHEDDLVGRLTDPQNPEYVEEEARKWKVLDLPALARDSDPLGRALGEPLWPEKFGREYLEAIRTRNAKGFASLYQGRPTLEDGDEFKADWLVGYKSLSELPKRMRYFGASDHAVSEKETADKTCMGILGIDADGDGWLLPDLHWERSPPDVTVDAMIGLMRRHKPNTWWAEDDHIKKSLGPFLRKRMREEAVHTVVLPSSPAKDMVARAQPLRGLMSLKRIHFPVFAPWWQDAKDELLKFPNGRHDDFVSMMSHMGRGVDRMLGEQVAAKEQPPPLRGTMKWIKSLGAPSSLMVRRAFKGW